MEPPKKYYVNCLGFELERCKKPHRAAVAGIKQQNLPSMNREANVQVLQNTDTQVPEVPKRTSSARRSKALAILYTLLVVSFLFWTALVILAIIYILPVMKQQEENRMEIQNLKTALQRSDVPESIIQVKVDVASLKNKTSSWIKKTETDVTKLAKKLKDFKRCRPSGTSCKYYCCSPCEKAGCLCCHA